MFTLALVLAATSIHAQSGGGSGSPLLALAAADSTRPVVGGGRAPAWPASDDEMPKNNMDMIYYSYGTACLGMDWRFLKAMSEIESGQDPRNHTGKYVGLFQIEPGEDKGDTCPTYIGPFRAVLGGCSDLEDPEVNTAVAAHRFHRYFKAEWLAGPGAFKADSSYRGIENVCPSASVQDKVALAYIGHNNGPAVLQHVLKQAEADPAICTEREKVRTSVRRFYEDHPGARDDGKFMKDGKLVECKDKSTVGKKTFRCVSGDYGVKKYEYGLRKADNITDINLVYPAGAINPEECPPYMEGGAKRLFACKKDRLTKGVLLGTGSVCP